MAQREVYFTADIIRPDGSDTDCYGEPCETGTGYVLESGWIDPDYSRSTVYESRDDVRPDVFDDDDTAPAQWLADTVTNRVGCVDSVSGESFYGADASTDYRTGDSVSMCAHAYGFSEAEIEEASALVLNWRARIA